MLAANQLINKILQTKDYNIIKTNSLESNLFVGYEQEFNFIVDHYKLYGNIPDTLTFISKFQNFELTEVNESNDYLVDKLYEEYGYNNFTKIIPVLGQKLKEDSRIAYDYIQNELPKLKPHAVCKGIDIIAQAQERYDIYKNRANDPEKLTIKTGLKELDEIFGGWEYGDELVTILSRTNMGKCHAKGTKILMADGTYKNVEDIQIGDKVQSYNRINTVTQLHHGFSKGYKIIPCRGGQPFIITDGHILTLWHRKQIWDSKNKTSTTNGTGELIDISIEDYLSKSKSFQYNCRLFRPQIEYNTKQQEVPAYILGLWLGDGDSRESALTTKDEEIKQEWINYAKSIKMNITVKQNFDKIRQKQSNCKRYAITKTGTGLTKNPFTQFLKQKNLKNNKHIPLEYLTGNRQQRLELLAGIIDTDGYCYNRETSHHYELSTKSEQLAKDYYQLLTGLGFKTSKKLCFNKKYKKYYYRLNFSGKVEDIPCRLSYKKVVINNRQVIRNSQLTNFNVERIDNCFEYFGFACDGDHRYLLEDGTITHNSWLLMKFLAEAWKQGKKVGLYSGEMNHIKLGYRFDALFNHFSNRALVQGFQTDDYEEYIKNLIGIPNPFIIITQKEFGGRPTVQKIKKFVEENNLEIVGIDQFSLMDDGRASFRDPSRLRLAHIAEDLFLLSSEYRIPVLGLAQANRESTKKESEMDAPGLENIKESDDIAHNSSKCIGMRQSSFGLILDIIKNREGKVGDKLLYNWEIDSGTFDYIPSADDAARTETRQQFTQQNRQQYTPTAGVNPF